MSAKRLLLSTAAVASICLAPGASEAQQQIIASATGSLNVRAGPGPEHQVVTTIPAGTQVSVGGCLQTGSWCQVIVDGTQGWAYSTYLVTDYSGQQFVIAENPAAVGVPVVTYDGSSAATGAVGGAAAGAVVGDPVGAAVGGATGAVAGGSGATGGSTMTGAVGGAVTGALVGGPVGAAVGGVIGATAGAAIDPPPQVDTYVTTNPTPSAQFQGQIAVGTAVPPTVTLVEVPNYQYQYAYVNQQPVLVDPGTRQIVYVY